MGYRTRETACITRLLPLARLSRRQRDQCMALRREAGRCWAALVTAHREARERGHWMSSRELELLVQHGYALHSQTVQALAQRLDANVQTARELREQAASSGDGGMRAYPYHTPEYQTVPWKDMALRLIDGWLVLSNGRGREALRVRLPAEYQHADIRRAELLWRADHFELALTLDTGVELPAPLEAGATAGIDLGEIHIAAIATSAGEALVIPGRYLRSCKRLRNKRHSAYNRRLARCSEGSRRWCRLRRRKAQASARCHRQQRDVLHQASRKAIACCQARAIGSVVIGDVRGLQKLPRRHNNQKIGQWAHGRFCRYVEEKAARAGVRVTYVPEEYSSLTCSACGSERHRAPQGRWFVCPVCGADLHRDANAAGNICSQGIAGRYGTVRVTQVRFVRPIVTRGHRQRGAEGVGVGGKLTGL